MGRRRVNMSRRTATLCLLLGSAWCFGMGFPAMATAQYQFDLFDFEFATTLPSDTEPKVDHVLVLKSERRLILFAGERSVADYGISLGRMPDGPKRSRGDGRTPEGQYTIDFRKADSDYYRALHISYPNAEDARHAREMGDQAGGSIMIHGLPNGLSMIGATHRLVDWTDGCIAVTNDEMDEIWERVDNGVSIEIRP